jgi:hypothetical protein
LLQLPARIFGKLVELNAQAFGLAGASAWCCPCQMLTRAKPPWESVMSASDRLTEMLMMDMSAWLALMSEVVDAT